MLLMSVASPAILADDCCDIDNNCGTRAGSCSIGGSCNACCPISDKCCPKTCQNNCTPNGCCPEACDTLDPCDYRVSAQSFFRVRPQFQGASPEKVAMWRLDRIYTREGGKHGSFQIVPFGGRTGKSRRLASYFMPFGKTELLVAEDEMDNLDRDIDATAFNIFTKDSNFKSRICFRPEQSTAGVGLSWRQKLSRNDEEKGFWFEASMPITHVRNSMNLSETVIEGGDGADDTRLSFAQPNMTTAFQQAAFNFGRIPCGCNNDLTKTGLADVDLRVGYGWQKEDMCHLESYIGVSIPTGNKVKGCNMFEAIVGHDHHVGFEFGTAGGFKIWSDENEEREIRTEFATHSVYFNKNTQRRSFDVKNNPWSRYLPVYCNLAAAQAAQQAGFGGLQDQGGSMYTSGINVFTQDVKVSGRFQRTYNTAFVFNSKRFSAEAGYNFFCRDAECVELCNWCSTVAFLDCSAQGSLVSQQTDNEGPGRTNRFRTISQCRFSCVDVVEVEDPVNVVEKDYNKNVVKREDLDLHSAAAPCQSQHTFYANIGYRWEDISWPTFVGLGGSYEFASDNTGLNRWLVWGKVGVSY